MKKFRDLKIGDNIFIGFEEKTITDIELGDKYAKITTKEQSLFVLMDSSCEYNKDFNKVVSVNKKSLVTYFEDRLKNLRTAYNMQKDYLENMAKKAKNLK